MKVLLVNKFFFLKGGAETVFFQNSSILEKHGIKFCTFSMKDERNFTSEYERFFVNNVDYHANHSLIDKIKISMNFVHNSDACRKIKDLISEEKPDIVHFHNVYHQLTPSVIKVAKNMGCKTVLTAHDYKVACPSYSCIVEGDNFDIRKIDNVFKIPFYKWDSSSWYRSLLMSMEAIFHRAMKTYHNVDVFIAPSEFMANKIKHRMSGSTVRVIENGVNVEGFKPSYKVEDYFVYFGRVSKEKGVDTLCRAYSNLSITTKLLIVGDGPDIGYLSGKYKNIDFVGFKSGEKLKEYISNARAVIVPSEWFENCSMAIIEALSLGKLIITTNCGGIPEQVRNGIEGHVYNSGDVNKLINILNDVSRQDKMEINKIGRNSRERARTKYSQYNHERKLIKLYKEIVGE